MTTAVQKIQHTLQLLKRDPHGVAQSAAHGLKQKIGCDHEIAVILGSGWDIVAPFLGEVTTDIPATELPGFLPPGVEGHNGRIQSIKAERKQVLAFLGRKHLYERDNQGNPLPVEATVHAVRTAAAAGCKSIVLTNAVGGLRREWPNGTAVLIKDHFSFFVRPALFDANFLQCHDVYSRRFRELYLEVVPNLKEGNYAQIVGPAFETPLEVSVLQAMKIDIVGMSIAIEAQAARDLKMEVVGLSIVTDYAGEPTTHTDVLAIVRQTAIELAPNLAAAMVRM